MIEIRLQISPLGLRKALEPEEIQVRDVRVSRVTMADGEGRARHGNLDPERTTGSADEGRLAAAKLARDGDHVANSQGSGKPCCDGLCLRRGGGVQLHGTQKRPS